MPPLLRFSRVHEVGPAARQVERGGGAADRLRRGQGGGRPAQRSSSVGAWGRATPAACAARQTDSAAGQRRGARAASAAEQRRGVRACTPAALPA